VRGSWWRLPSVFPSGSRSAVLGSRSSGVGDLAGSGGAGVIGWFPLSNPARRGARAVDRMGQDEAGTLRRLRDHRRELIDPEIAEHKGRVVKTRAFAQVGAAVGVNYRSKASAADELVREIRDQGGEAVALKADVSRDDEVRARFDRLVEAFGRIDILVANAGMRLACRQPADPQAWHRMVPGDEKRARATVRS
jgi:hypothetical protein